MGVERLLSRLQGVRSAGPGRWQALCPAHKDTKPSLSIREASDGTVLLHCHAGNGCNAAKIVEVMGLTLRDLFPSKPARPRPRDTTERKVTTYPTLKAAIAACAQATGGQHVGTWTYRLADGAESFHVARFNLPDGTKQFRPIRREGGGYAIGDPPGKLPLYRLPELGEMGRVYVLEGEKCADAAWSIGLTATCSAHGAKGAHKTDWRPLAGRDVVILPDADAAGRGYAEAVASILRNLTPPATVRIVDLPGLSEGEDIVDFLEERDSTDAEDLREYIEGLAAKTPPIGDGLAEVRAEIEAEARGERRPIPLPFASRLCRLARPTVSGNVLVVAGSPGTAKSFLALNMLVAAVDAGMSASYLPLESDRAFHLRRLAAVLDRSWDALADPLKDPHAPELARAALERCEKRLADLQNSILENPCRPVREGDKLVVPEVTAETVLEILEHRARVDKLVIFDPFAMVSFGGREEWREQDRFVRRLVGLAAETGAVICIVAHLVKRPDYGRELSLGDLQGASALSRLAATVIIAEQFGRREVDVWFEGHLHKTVETNLILTIAKSRHGEGTGVRLAYTFGHAGPTFEEHGVVAGKARHGGGEHWVNA